MNTVTLSMTMVMGDGEKKRVLFDICQRMGYKDPLTFYQLKGLLMDTCTVASDIIFEEEVAKPCG